ncbi:hypothetical protein [Micromonospora carbonacea]|uniref:Uncharacterized protein n=1 Tax=Micromonospora carbonacea TaxID=47853 RepID=A0A1C5ATR8_9ACTN|nr:hypothetical protein [Micromonospora carbonacea]SCF48625.1 hypothetical protein GA0070563_11961 [Micromonospora carbonacea]
MGLFKQLKDMRNVVEAAPAMISEARALRQQASQAQAGSTGLTMVFFSSLRDLRRQADEVDRTYDPGAQLRQGLAAM